MLSMTEGDVAYLLDCATRYTCLKLGIGDFGLITEDEMLKAIGSVNPTAHPLLSRFITSYREWFQFGKTCEEAHKTGSMTEANYRELLNLMDEREKSRKAIVSFLQTLP